MPLVVVVGWDAGSRLLRFVPVENGRGGGERVVVVPDWYADEVSAQCGQGPLPRVGELVVEDDGCLLDLSGPSARWCRANRRNRAVRLTDPDTGDEVAVLSPALVGLTDDEALGQRVNQIGPFLLFDLPQPVAGCWVREGGLTGWRAEETDRQERAAAQREADRIARAEAVRRRAVEAANRALEEAEHEARLRRERTDRFVNPYTFVPFPARIVRGEPAGHDRLAPGRMSGRLVVRWEFTAPVQAPDSSVDGGELRFPGSSVKGAVRSVHETLAGGCLRVVDPEFVPSYRDTASALSDEWTLAVVSEVTRDGQPLAVRPADKVVWVRAGQLIAACGAGLRTGSRVGFQPPRDKNSLGRYELSEDAPVSAGGDWVVLLTDATVRPKTRKDGSPALYFAACGRVPDSAPRWPVTEDAWRTFRQAVAGAREVVQARSPDPSSRPDPWPEVRFRGELVGRRKAVTGRFDQGDVLWVRQDRAGGVVELRLSAIWRHPGAGPLGKRIPPHLSPCTDPTALCPSCRLFGSADTRARDEDGRAEQRAYAGHIRFGDAVSAGPVPLTKIRRVPLSTPRPGAGQFYLAYEDRSPARKGNPPTREWGAEPDRPDARLVRGRKFYWHTEPGDHPSRYEAREHHHRSKMVTEKLLAPPGTVLWQTITFDNLDGGELGGLLAALEPQRVLHRGDAEARGPLRLHLGGGKPLGLGSCTATVTGIQVWDADSRYGDGPDPAFAPEAAVDAFVGSCPDEVAATWPALAAVLAADTVNPAQVWYPPGADWPDRERKPKQFDEPFAFFAVTSGMHMADGQERPLLPLPDPTAPDQTLPIIHKTHAKGYRPEERWT
ncbi:TIGR03986 family CRISPR-associated RAMP protein [Plantactinospora sp. B5E13]|uniref:TIGR03986 family type III CRISPR-associated RAMP protein n=1 Tax=Plantactinospora sp. B5E13 TaxID=3153758 RepID=UPI00325CFDFE